MHVVGVLGATLNNHRIVARLDLTYLFLVGTQDHILLRILLQVLVALLHSSTQVHVVVLLGLLLCVAIPLVVAVVVGVVGEATPLRFDLSALGAVSYLVLLLLLMMTYSG